MEVGGQVEEIASAIEIRDQQDSSREVSPLIQASDAILIDASDLDPMQVVGIMIEKIEKLL